MMIKPISKITKLHQLLVRFFFRFFVFLCDFLSFRFLLIKNVQIYMDLFCFCFFFFCLCFVQYVYIHVLYNNNTFNVV